MHILIALTYYRPHYSGLTIYAEREARALAKRGHQVTVLTSRFDPRLPAHEVRDHVEIIRPRVLMHVSKGVIMPTIPYWAWKEIRQADVVHLHVPQLDAAPIAVLSRLLCKPVVLTYHCDLHLPSGFIHSIANQVSNLANTIAARAANVIVQNTRDYAENSPFLRQYLHKVQPVLPPVEMETVSQEDILTFRQKFNLQPEQRIIGIAARLAAEKGVEYLAEALPKVMEKYPTARVLFVGPYQNVVGEEQYALQMAPLIAELGEHWSFLGILSPVEMAAFFHVCEVTVLPSINSTESFGMVQVEAMTCGTAVVATNLPGVRVPVQLSGMGRIVPPASPDPLAMAILAILDHPEAYRGRPEAIVPLMTPETVAEHYEAIFKRLVAKEQPALKEERLANRQP